MQSIVPFDTIMTEFCAKSSTDRCRFMCPMLCG